MVEKYAVLYHNRWLETEEPKATVMRTRDGEVWHPMCVTDPDTAHEIVWALRVKMDDAVEVKRVREIENE